MDKRKYLMQFLNFSQYLKISGETAFGKMSNFQTAYFAAMSCVISNLKFKDKKSKYQENK